ncbi:MAG: right-handed parallel beta-helix repeat-containing protein, partial [Desulfobacterales bacterium]|nr:right-handed parallel beta-helix repeat-containing protein [Desulfobacterales bacterium]
MRVHKIKLTFVCLIFFAVKALPVLTAGARPEVTCYVDPQKGKDTHAGTISKPWRTIKHALNNLKPNSILYLRGGVYKESNIVISDHLLENQSISIQGYPNEYAIIDGSFEFFHRPNNSWTLFNADKQIYVSTPTFSNLKNVFGQIESKGKLNKLVTYKSMADLSSGNGYYVESGDLYVGPGIYYEQESGKIYIRLVKPKNLPQDSLYDPAIHHDPRKSNIYISRTNFAFIVDSFHPNSKIRFTNILIRNHYASFLLSSSNNIEIENIVFSPTKYGVLIKKASSHIKISHSRFKDNIPDWISWSDVKMGTKPAHSMQNNAIEINPGSKNVTISDCTFSRSWDAVSALADADNILIYGNSFTNIRDDGIQLGSSTSNVDIGYNRMIHVFTGISRHGSGDCPEPGTKFIHHNIIDSSKPMFARRGDPLNLLKKKHAWLNGPEMMNNPPFGVHRLKHIGT